MGGQDIELLASPSSSSSRRRPRSDVQPAPLALASNDVPAPATSTTCPRTLAGSTSVHGGPSLPRSRPCPAQARPARRWPARLLLLLLPQRPLLLRRRCPSSRCPSRRTTRSTLTCTAPSRSRTCCRSASLASSARWKKGARADRPLALAPSRRRDPSDQYGGSRSEALAFLHHLNQARKSQGPWNYEVRSAASDASRREPELTTCSLRCPARARSPSARR